MGGDGGTDPVPEALYVIRCRICDRKLMGVSYPVVLRPKTLGDLNLLQSGQDGAWCGYCKQVTVFVGHPRA